MSLSNQERAALKLKFATIFHDKYSKKIGPLINKVSTDPIYGNLIVILWRPSQNAFHRETLNEYINASMRSFVEQNGWDWIILGVFKTKEDADEFSTLINQARKDFLKEGGMDFEE